MQKSLFLICVSLVLLLACDSPEQEEVLEVSIPELLPLPQELRWEEGTVTFQELPPIVYDSATEKSARLLAQQMERLLGKAPMLVLSANNANRVGSAIVLKLNPQESGPVASYSLVLDKRQVKLSASDELGLFYGMQTLLQIMHQSREGAADAFHMRRFVIKDAPRFPHRGMLLDECRHFFGKEVVKKYIDLLAHYKMNVLHWHLTEDQGWRLAIDAYPKLTEVGAYRIEQDGSTYGGFYTKADIREIVAYAKERFITIIPEIEMPGHAQAALAAYPQFSCKGHGIEVVNDWGVFKEIYCAGNDATFTFLEDVLTEVMELFPSEYIHIGGDEAPKFRWENCSKCQKRMATEGLKDAHELQSYFISRIEAFLNKNGRQLIGWDEILEGGLAPNATLQSWRGMEHGKHAAESKHNVVMSPTSHSYFDYDLKSIDLEKVYSFDPIPTDLDSAFHSYIIGGEANMWTERVPDEANLDSKVFPRLLAMAEVLWTYPDERNYAAFSERVQAQYPFLEEQGVAYGLEGETVNFELNNEGGGFYIHLTGLPNTAFQYSIQDSFPLKPYLPDTDGPIWHTYSDSLIAQAMRHGEPYGPRYAQRVESHKALQSPIQLSHPPSQWYEGSGAYALTDGMLGSLDFRDGNWVGFWGKELEAILDLEGFSSIESVTLQFYQYSNSWIFMPAEVEVWLSKDGENWNSAGRQTLKTEQEQRGKIIEALRFDLPENSSAKFLKVRAEKIGKVPNWHEAAGADAWIFIDEIVVR